MPKERKDTNKISELCSQANEPILSTNVGCGDTAIPSMKAMQEQQEQRMLDELCPKLDLTTAMDGDTVMRRIKENYVDKACEEKILLAECMHSMKQAANGETVDGKTAIRKLKESYGK